MKQLLIRIKYAFLSLLTDFNRHFFRTAFLVIVIAAGLWFALDGVWGSVALTRWSLLRDYATFWNTVETACPGAQESAQELSQIRSRYRAKAFFTLSVRGYYELFEQLCDEIEPTTGVTLLQAEHYVYQLNYYLDTYYGSYNAYYVHKYMSGSADPWYETLVSKRVLRRYELFAKAMGDDFDATAAAYCAERGAADAIVTEISADGKTAFLTIPSMRQTCLEADRKRLAAFYTQAADCENVVIRLDDDGCGTDRYWMELLVQPNLSEPLEAAFWGSFDPALHNDAVVGEYIQSFLSETGQRTEDGRAVYSVTRRCEPEGEPTLKGRLWLLCDADTDGAAADFADFCAQTGFATTVGRPVTAPLCREKEAFCLLPASRLLVRMPLLQPCDAAGNPSDAAGLTPDVLSEADESPLQTCLRALQSAS